MAGNVTFNPNYDVPVTGTITALNGVVALDLLQKDIQSVSILGTWTATLIFEGSNDGTNWFTIPAINVSTNAIVFSTAANGNFLVPAGGMSQTRVRASAFTSGTVNIANEGANEGLAQFVFQNNHDSLKGTVKVTDGTDTQGVSTNGDAKVVDGMRNGGVYGALNIPTANTPVEAKVGVSRLSNRKLLMITIENNGIFWGLDNSVTTTSGISTVNGQVLTFAIDPDSTFQVWLVGNANNKNVHIAEIP